MLLSLQVRDFAIIEQLDMEFAAGMTVLTGETGAGKSILVDALGLVLGERASGQPVRNGAVRAEFSAEFNISAMPEVKQLLEDQALEQDNLCLLRRVIGADGRSRAFINGNAATLQQLKLLGELLLDIHGQHFHQSLVRRPVQRELLDHYGGLSEQREAVEAAYAQWRVLADELQGLQDDESSRASRLELLQFQLSELDALALGSDEYEALLAERQKQLHGGRLAEGVTLALAVLADDDSGNAGSLVAEAERSIAAIQRYDGELLPVQQLLESAAIQLSEAVSALQHYAAALQLDPQRRDWIEERLDSIQAIARKHRIEPTQIPELHDELREQVERTLGAEERGQKLAQAVQQAKDNFLILARSLTVARGKAARRFAAAITETMNSLGMPGGKFAAQLTALSPDDPRPWGLDDIEFLISANPGQPMQAMARIASGGELSRMSLAIQVIASAGSKIPTMIFDEVDSGVGGSVAEMVGRRLQEVGAQRQVLCVTHLPQVASLGDIHFRISKVTDGKVTKTNVRKLADDERIQEIARMLGGVEITQKTVEHAAEMLAGARRKLA